MVFSYSIPHTCHSFADHVMRCQGNGGLTYPTSHSLELALS